MASLYKRATPPQARILRIVAGAVLNAGDAHPEYGLDKKIARSIAKRACGTLTAGWQDVLAAKAPIKGFNPSNRSGVLVLTSAPLKPSHCLEAAGSAQIVKPNRRGASQRSRRSPLGAKLTKDIGVLASESRRAGSFVRAAAFEQILRLLALHEGEI